MPGVFPHSLIMFWSFKLGNKAKPPSSCNNNNSSNKQQPPGVLSTWLFSVLLLHNRATVIQAWKHYNNSIEISKLNILKPDLWRREVFSCCCCCFIWSKFFCFVIHHFRFLIKNSEREERKSDSVIFYRQKNWFGSENILSTKFRDFFRSKFQGICRSFWSADSKKSVASLISIKNWSSHILVK